MAQLTNFAHVLKECVSYKNQQEDFLKWLMSKANELAIAIHYTHERLNQAYTLSLTQLMDVANQIASLSTVEMPIHRLDQLNGIIRSRISVHQYYLSSAKSYRQRSSNESHQHTITVLREIYQILKSCPRAFDEPVLRVGSIRLSAMALMAAAATPVTDTYTNSPSPPPSESSQGEDEPVFTLLDDIPTLDDLQMTADLIRDTVEEILNPLRKTYNHLSNLKQDVEIMRGKAQRRIFSRRRRDLFVDAGDAQHEIGYMGSVFLRSLGGDPLEIFGESSDLITDERERRRLLRKTRAIERLFDQAHDEILDMRDDLEG